MPKISLRCSNFTSQIYSPSLSSDSVFLHHSEHVYKGTPPTPKTENLMDCKLEIGLWQSWASTTEKECICCAVNMAKKKKVSFISSPQALWILNEHCQNTATENTLLYWACNMNDLNFSDSLERITGLHASLSRGAFQDVFRPAWEHHRAWTILPFVLLRSYSLPAWLLLLPAHAARSFWSASHKPRQNETASFGQESPHAPASGKRTG